jgi:hypothetical protein
VIFTLRGKCDWRDQIKGKEMGEAYSMHEGMEIRIGFLLENVKERRIERLRGK